MRTDTSAVITNRTSELSRLVRHDLSRDATALPELPRSAAEAMRIARAAVLDLDAAARLAERDPPLTARILAVANSALFARGGRHVSPRRAIAHIGGAALRDVLYQAAYASMVFEVPRYAAEVSRDFVHGVATAALSRALARVARADPEDAFLAGLLHDIGRARCWASIARRANGLCDDDALFVVDALHAAAGHGLLRAWQLPPEIADVCMHHHAGSPHELVAVVAAADALVHAAEHRPDSRAPIDLLSAIGVDATGVLAWLQRAEGELVRARLMTGA